MNIHMIIVSIGVGIIAAGILYVWFICIAAKREITKAPRADMFVCDKHGPMPMSSTFTLMDGDMDQTVQGRTVRGPVRTCPVCFADSIRKAGKS